ncbi:helix-turn-helix domain-containing protein [Litoreibacter janthinus]|uniref:DNA binding domain-containing protein, excisionase family n=1 Tax=Litoreibacter janthinus TaxID=670154 RepID=A0A1I6H0N9_9RHOB|nr:helix-turn-helix domain-containing protein [Litoreibacter janthinus]SFR47907.1 DNA binding domain-containing protein, excisionase family [Litoreibacter janthinus]
MPRFPAPSRIKSHRIYTVWEAAEALGRHRQTIIRWIKEKGLIADRSQRPWLIRGSDLKVFLGQGRKKSRCKLNLHQLYCLGCKLPQEPDGKFADYLQTTPSSGMLSALCPDCGCIMNKMIRRADLGAVRAKIAVTVQQANPRLVFCTDAHSNVTFRDEDQTHVKTRTR